MLAVILVSDFFFLQIAQRKRERGRGRKRESVCTCRSFFALIWTLLHKSIPLCSCLFRIVDSFGTEPAFNHRVFAKQNKILTSWGGQDLNPRQFFTMFREYTDRKILCGTGMARTGYDARVTCGFAHTLSLARHPWKFTKRWAAYFWSVVSHCVE